MAANARTGKEPIPPTFGRRGRETEAGVGQPVQVGQMLADRHARAEQDRVDRPGARAGVVDIVAVDADQPRAARHQRLRGGGGQVRVIIEIGVGAPMLVPAGVEQHRLAPHIEPDEIRCVDGEPFAVRRADDQSFEADQPFQPDPGEIVAVRVAMEGHVQVGAGVGHHVDPADLEGRAVIVEGGGGLARPIVADRGRRQAFVGDHAAFDQVAEVDDLRIRHRATNPIIIQITLSTAEGSAPCHQLLTMKPAAPTTFMP